MNDGAWGLSTGLIYNPGTYAKTDELIALARVAARHGGFYASHIRDEGTGVLAAINEALTIGREAGLPVHISHLKASGRRAWGRAADEIALIDKARQSGQAVSADQYPYIASSTSLKATLIPTSFREGSQKDYVARLDDAEQLARLRPHAGARHPTPSGRQGHPHRSLFLPNPPGRASDLAAIAAAENKARRRHRAGNRAQWRRQIVSFSMNEEDVRLIMRQPFVATASDGGLDGALVRHGAASAQLRLFPAQDRPLCHRGQDSPVGAGHP